MKYNFIRYSMIILIGLATLAPGRAYPRENNQQIELLSLPFGIASGQTARVSVVQFAFADGSVRMFNPAVARIQLLDAEGEVVAQSDELRIEPGKIRFWDVSRDQLRAEGDPGTGRLQVRTRILVTTGSSAVNCNRLPLAPTIELINPRMGETTSNLFRFW